MQKKRRRIPAKKIKKKKKSFIGKLLLLLFLLIAIVCLGISTPYFNVTEIRVSGNIRVPQEDILNASGVTVGTNIFKYKLSKISQGVETIPYVADAKVKRVFPNKVDIAVTESEIAGVIPYLGNGVLIDRYGKALETVGADQISEYLVINGTGITGYEEGKKIVLENESRYNIITEIVKTLMDKGKYNTVNEIDVSNADAIILKLNQGKLTVLVGDSKNLTYKMDYMSEILNQLGESPKGYLDLTAKDATYRLNQEGPTIQPSPERENRQPDQEQNGDQTGQGNTGHPSTNEEDDSSSNQEDKSNAQ